MKFEIFKEKTYKFFLIILFLIWGIISFSTIFNIYNNEVRPLDAIVILIGVFVSLLALVGLYRGLGHLSERQHNKLALVLFLVCFSVMYVWGISYQVLPTYDLSHIVSKVEMMLESGSHHFGNSPYFSIYPEQIHLTMFIYGIESIGKMIMFNPGNFMILYNAFMTSFTLYIIYRIIKKLFGSRIALLGFILLAIYPDFTLFVSYYYTDIISLPFAMFGYYLLLKSEEREKGKSICYSILAGISFAIGFKLRVVTFILFIAYIIDSIGHKRLGEFVFKVGPTLFAMLVSLCLYKSIIYPSFHVEIDESLRLPATHWVMMGLNERQDGGYEDADAMYSIRSKNKNKAIFKRIKKRLSTVNENFYITKLSRTWSTGDHDILRKYGMLKNEKYDSIYQALEGKKNVFIKYFQQILKATIYFLFLITLGSELVKKYKDSKVSTFIIAVFGAILFYLLWEALNRYSFSFLPWILIAAIPSVSIVDQLLSTNIIAFDKIKFDFKKLKEITCIIVFTLTVILLGINFFKYTVYKYKIDFPRLVQDNSTKHFIPVIDSEIKEVFRVKNDFNQIKLNVNNEKVNKKLDYIYELYNDKQELIYRGKVGIPKGISPTKEKPISLRNIRLTFPVIEVNKKQEFTLKFYSKKATKRNYASLNSFVLEDNVTDYKYFSPEFLGNRYDVNPSGETYVNNHLLDGSLKLVVSLNKKTSIMQVWEYLLLSSIIISIVFISMRCTIFRERRRK